MTLSIQCSCGDLKGTLNQSGSVNRGVCYCADCQAFARFLGREDDVLDQAGGTEIVQIAQEEITFTEGVENLACMCLTEKGLLRWYAVCCNTPIGNTPRNFKISVIGLIHNCLNQGQDSLREALGPIRMHVGTKYARGTPKPKSAGLMVGVLRVIGMILGARLDRSYKRSPFFVPGSGAPVVAPRVLSTHELKGVKDAV